MVNPFCRTSLAFATLWVQHDISQEHWTSLKVPLAFSLMSPAEIWSRDWKMPLNTQILKCANLQVRPGLQWRVHTGLLGFRCLAAIFLKQNNESLPHLQQIVSQKVAVTTSDPKWSTPKTHWRHSRLILAPGSSWCITNLLTITLRPKARAFAELIKSSTDRPFVKWFHFAFYYTVADDTPSTLTQSVNALHVSSFFVALHPIPKRLPTKSAPAP